MALLENVEDLLSDDPATPYDLKLARRDSIDYHRRYGMPAIIKRAYNSDHVAFQEGPQGESVRRDTTFDDAYGQGFYSPNGAIGFDGKAPEYGAGWFTYITLQDATIDDSDPTNMGSQKLLSTRGEVGWKPTIWDNDLIILVAVEYHHDKIEIVAAGDRFIVQQVTPITMRGQATNFYMPNQESQWNYLRDGARLIAQQFSAVRMPRYHRVYNVGII